MNRLPKGTRRRIQQREIADRAGVSVSTVSRVLNNVAGISDTLQRRVLEVAAELGYTPAQPSLNGMLHTVSLFTNLPAAPLLDPFHADILSGVEAECRRHGVHLNIATVAPAPESTVFVIERIRQTSTEGLLLLSVDDRPLVEYVLGLDLPVVTINAEYPDLPIDSFLPDNRYGPMPAMRHLIAHGHRRILHMTHLRRRTIRQRLMAYRNALEEAGIAYDPTLVIELSSLEAEEAYTALVHMTKSGKLDATAIFCATDTVAMARCGRYRKAVCASRRMSR
ncbi:MAG: LacI family transcriptional regulator [Blastochloris sp.]|nr:LacI family transcriptional regulator [Blastochloris sp.]